MDDARVKALIEQTVQDPTTLGAAQRLPSQKLSSGVVPMWDSKTKNWKSSTAATDALAIPVLKADFGGSAVGFVAGNYLCNQDGQPKAPATLQNFRVITFTYDDVIDAPPPGYKVQWQLVINPKPNGTNSLVTWTFSPFVLSGGGGGAGGFTETLSGTFISPSCSVASPGSFATFGSGWVNGNVTGGIQAGSTYAFLVNLNTGMAGNSAFSWTGRLFRRFVPV